LPKLEVCQQLGAAGIATGPCFSDEEVVKDPHVAAHNMLVEIPRADGITQPILTPGNPIKLSKMAEGPETRFPWVGEHTRDVLEEFLGLSDEEIRELERAGAI
jgi:crotonobetainyl-CoA:carnitine CoA-transferase CaiB-like acyl-CoA transferase